MDNALIARPIHFPAAMVMSALWLGHHKRQARQNNPQRMLDSICFIAYNFAIGFGDSATEFLD